MKITENKLLGCSLFAYAFVVLLYVGGVAGLLYIAWHFVSKLW